MDNFIKKIEIISLNAFQIGVKHLIFPFLENSTPDTKLKRKKLILLLNKISEITSKKLFISIETDLKPSILLALIKKMKNKIFINYDLGNSASKNYLKGDFIVTNSASGESSTITLGQSGDLEVGVDGVATTTILFV